MENNVVSIRHMKVVQRRRHLDLWTAHIGHLELLRASFEADGEATDLVDALILGVRKSIEEARLHLVDLESLL